MSSLYLITGFLGAGKTTLLRNFVRLFPDKKLFLIINEFGKEGVDGTLLKQAGAMMEEINNGSIFCACRLEQFSDALLRAGKAQPDVIIVEASGLSDPTNVRKMLKNSGRFPFIEYKGCLCVVDCVRFQKLYQTARVLKKQLAVSDLAVLNKTDLAGGAQVEAARQIIAAQRPGLPVHNTAFGALESGWLLEMDPGGELETALQTADLTLKKLTVTLADNAFSKRELEKFLEIFLEDTYRVKGFVRMENKVYLVDCVGNLVSIELFEGETGHINKLVALSGDGLPMRKSLRMAAEWYPGKVLDIE